VRREMLEEVAHDEEHLSMLLRLAPSSWMVVPLRVRERVLGGITLALSERRRQFGPRDVAMAEDLAYTAALAIDNALSYSKARAATQTRNRILEIVVHDLRNPLSAISLAAEMLQGRPTDSPDAELTIDSIAHAAQRMSRLVENLINTRSIESGQLSLECIPQPLGLLLEVLRTEISALAARWSINLQFDVPADLPLVSIDRDRIWEALVNLIENALKFSSKGETVTLRAVAEEKGVRLSISDTGPGISPENLEAIFQFYWRSYTLPRQRGTGLGLGIARAIVEAHGGEVSVESQLGKGSTFHVVLPARTAEPPPGPAGAPRPVSSPAARA
jgi:signal transduction histidine kinase